METIVVTGGAGFIGSNFVRYLLAHTVARVIVVDKLTYAGHLCTLADVLADQRACLVQADIADRPAIEAVFQQHQPSTLVNFAAETHVDRSIDDPRPFIDTNVTGTFELLEAARRFIGRLDAQSAGRFRFLHVSTDEVYGSLGPSGLFSETTAYAPNSPYAASKAAADHLVRAYFHTYKLPALITNCSNNYGPFQFPEKLVPLMILNAVEGKPLPIYGDGGNIRDWLYVEDHCAGVMTVLERGRVGEKYNIGGRCEQTNLQVVDTICARVEEVLPAAENTALRERGVARYEDLKHFVPDRPGHDRRYAIDATRMRDELGWSPNHDFDKGIAETIRWYLNNQTWCAQVQAANYDRERLGVVAAKVSNDPA
jgi:dTDP-glucose 4,6-dehydratase